MHFAITSRNSYHNNPKQNDYFQLQNPQVTVMKSHRNQPLKSGFISTWSQIHAQSITPPPRKDPFSVYVPELNGFFMGFGISESKDLCDDVWFYNTDTLKWSRINLTGEQLVPRTGTKAVYLANNLILFGGFSNNEFFNDLHRIDLSNGAVSRIETTGDFPAPRCHCIMVYYNKSIAIWGGNSDQGTFNELSILSLETFAWTKYPTNVPGRTGMPYVLVGNTIYSYGGSKGLLSINLDTKEVSVLDTIGCVPDPQPMLANLVHADKFLFFFGGQKVENEKYDLIYCLDLEKMWWFIFFLTSDGSTTTAEDGFIDKLGLFNIPNVFGSVTFYNEKKRQIYYTLGFPLVDPPPVYAISIGEALGVLHLRDDMLQIFKAYP